MKVREIFPQWIESKVTCTLSTKKSYTERLKLLGPILDMELNSICERDTVSLVSRLKERGLRGESVRAVTKLLKQINHWGWRNGHTHNEKLFLPAVKIENSPRRPFTREHYVAILNECTKDKYCADWFSACIFGWNTGMRIGDTIRVEWDHVDMENELLHLWPLKKQNVTQHLEIPIEPELMQHLEFLKAHRTKSPHVLSALRLKLDADPRWFYAFRHILNAVGLRYPHYTFHSFRHSFISRMFNAGVDAKIIGSLTGQAVTTVYRYVHVSNDAKKIALEKARAAMFAARQYNFTEITPPTKGY